MVAVYGCTITYLQAYSPAFGSWLGIGHCVGDYLMLGIDLEAVEARTEAGNPGSIVVIGIDALLSRQ